MRPRAGADTFGRPLPTGSLPQRPLQSGAIPPREVTGHGINETETRADCCDLGVASRRAGRGRTRLGPGNRGDHRPRLQRRDRGTDAYADVMLIGRGLGSTTNAHGEFFIDHVPDGEYVVHASFTGFDTGIARVTVEVDRTTGDRLPPRCEALRAGQRARGLTATNRRSSLRTEPAPSTERTAT